MPKASEKCPACRKLTLRLVCRDGRSRLFQPDPVTLDEDPFRAGFILAARMSRGRPVKVIAVPVRDVSDRRLGPDVRVWCLHFCPEWVEYKMRIRASDLAGLFDRLPP